MLKKEFREIKIIFYIFFTIIISMGQSILLINRVYSDNLTAIFFIHFLSCLLPIFLFEQIIDKSSRIQFLSMLLAIYCILVFAVFPEQLIVDNGVRTIIKIVGTFLPAISAVFLYKRSPSKL